MSPPRSRPVLLLLPVALLGAGRVTAQSLENRAAAFAGGEARILTFDGLPPVRRLRQFVVPVGVVLPLGRFTFDIGAAYASTELTRPDSTRHQVNHLTDTQVRGAYVFGRDAVVATVVVNLPTGPRSASTKDYTVLGAVSPSFLGYPVAAYANGFSVTSGLAGAVQTGDWSLGLAGSLRVSSRFTPYVDSAGPISYKPGLEGRIRGGLDGLVGSSQLSLGFTYSTFGDDQFGVATTARGQYRPGPRWLAEAALVAPIGASRLSLSAWNFRRTAGDTTGFSAKNRENLFAGELSISIPLTVRLDFEPVLSGRLSKPELGRARMGGAGAGLRIRLSDHVSLAPLARYDSGWLENENGARNSLRGGYASAFLHASF